MTKINTKHSVKPKINYRNPNISLDTIGNPYTLKDKNTSKIFVYHHRILFNETNAAGGVVYFSNYSKWQGMMRELWFVDVVEDWKDIMIASSTGKLNMITVEEHSHFIKHAYFGDRLEMQLRMTNAKSYSFEMIFLIYNDTTKELLYEGMQKLAFDDFKGKFIPIPNTMKNCVLEYSVDTKDLKLLKLKT